MRRNTISTEKQIRINSAITAEQVRVIVDNTGEQLGVIDIEEALKKAEELGADLVEISPNANPPVCKIMDYGKFKYREQKKAHEMKMKQKQVHLKEIKLRPVTDDHDYQIKLKNAKRFLEDGDKVKFVVQFRGREMAHQELGLRYLERAEKDLAEEAVIEQKPKIEGRNALMIVTGKKKVNKKE
ncbi:MAG TPA: translation initiation factor IF-3 [Burkholderiales bacterium]|nr:translation initiation factor IF-3 [Burkholderiales bacterium]